MAERISVCFRFGKIPQQKAQAREPRERERVTGNGGRTERVAA